MNYARPDSVTASQATDGPNPSGLCQCGCGELAPIASKTSSRDGLIKGQAVRFVSGHNSRLGRRWDIDTLTGCWNWLKWIRPDGYGRAITRRNGRKQAHLAHRFVYEKYKGKIPEGLELDHLCRNKRCVNPEHLEPVDRKTNQRRSRATKLTVEQARSVKELKEAGARPTDIATQFGITLPTVCNIVKGRIWKDLA